MEVGKIIFLSKWVIGRFRLLILQGASISLPISPSKNPTPKHLPTISSASELQKGELQGLLKSDKNSTG